MDTEARHMSRPTLQVDLLVESFNYKAWSDRRTLDAIARIDAEAFPASLAFALQQLNHMAIVEELFRARLLGEPAPHQQTNSEVVPGYDVRVAGWRIRPPGSPAMSPSLPLERRGEWLRFRFADGRDGGMTRQEILFHIVNHGTYHRGAIGHALDLAGAPRPADTYTLYIPRSRSGIARGNGRRASTPSPRTTWGLDRASAPLRRKAPRPGAAIAGWSGRFPSAGDSRFRRWVASHRRGAVDRHDAAVQLDLGLGRIFGGELLAFGVQQHQEIGGAFAIADRRLLRGGAAGFRLADQRDQALLALAIVAEGIRRFFQGQQHLLFVAGQRGVGVGLGAAQAARTLPRSKAAQLMLGPTLQARAALEPICEPRPAVKPRKPLRLTRGNRSAVATPTSAVLAARRRSAARMSGRRRSSPGSPIGRALVIAGRSRGERSTVNSSGRWPRRVAIRCLARSASACSCGTLAAVAARRASARSTSSSAPTPASRSCSVSWRDSFWFSRLLRAIFSRSCAARLAVGVHQRSG